MTRGTRNRAASLRLNRRSSTGGRRKGLRSSAAAELVRTWIDDAVQLMVEMPFTCVLDVVATYPHGLPASGVGWILGVSRQAIDQEESQPHVQDALEELREFIDDE